MNKGQKVDLEEGVYKFVKTSDGEFVFLNIMTSEKQHKDMVPEGKIPVAAGAITVGKEALLVAGKTSTTLGLGWGDKEKKELEALLHREFLN